MHITLLHYAAPPVVGGVESVLGHQARLLTEAGHIVQVVAGRGAQVDPRIPFTPLALADSRHPEIMAVKTELDAGRVPAIFADLVTALESELAAVLAGSEVMIAHNVCSLAKNLPLTAALHRYTLRPGAPRLILWHHDLAWTTPRYRAELHEGYPWDLLRTDWPHAAQVVVSAERRRELAALLDVPPARIRVVPNGVDAAEFLKLTAQTRALIAPLDLFSAAPLLLLPVRVTPRKNIELALQTLAVLRAEFPNARLVVTGPLGPHNPANMEYFARLTALRAALGLVGSAHFFAELTADYLPDAVIADCYRLADALFFPSREEGFGIPILEAGLAGLPVFCADIPPLRELGGAEVTYFSPEAEPATVAAAVAARLHTDPVYTLRVRVRQHYTWEQIYTAHLAPLLEFNA